jgi:hypothetical protein
MDTNMHAYVQAAAALKAKKEETAKRIAALEATAQQRADQ